MLFVASFIFFQMKSKAQETKTEKKEEKTAAIADLIKSKNFVFVAQYASPLGGQAINLTSVYDVKLSTDTIISELPYFGRAYIAPLNPSEGGINFRSTKFTYTVNPKKKSGWDITILPEDTQDARQMFLSVSKSGYASLMVESNNRQAINFSGYIISKDKFR